MQTIKLAVSGCLLGQNVRYDGRNKAIDLRKYFPLKQYKLEAICPEVAMGLSVPRPAIQIRQLPSHANSLQLVQVDNLEINYTKQFEQWFKANYASLATFAGFILKSKSPSCGYKTTPHFQQDNDCTYGDGIFVHYLRKKQANVAIIDEQQLRNSLLLEHFKRLARLFHRNAEF